jgi:hypothetical protein
VRCGVVCSTPWLNLSPFWCSSVKIMSHSRLPCHALSCRLSVALSPLVLSWPVQSLFTLPLGVPKPAMHTHAQICDLMVNNPTPVSVESGTKRYVVISNQLNNTYRTTVTHTTLTGSSESHLQVLVQDAALSK